METLFTPYQFVRCVDSKGTTADGTPIPLVEGKKEQVKAVHILSTKENNYYVVIELFGVEGFFMEDRFLPEEIDNELENEIFNIMKK